MDWNTTAGPCLLLTLLWWRCGSECPADTTVRAQQCLTNLTWGIAPSDDDDNGYNDIHGFAAAADSFARRGIHQPDPESGSVSGSRSRSKGVIAVSLDYRKIREYCAERHTFLIARDGHMLRFVHCVEELSLRCPDLPPDGVVGHLINPQRVHTSIPNLCSHEDEIEEKSECMNSMLKEGSTCRERASNAIAATAAGLPLSTSNDSTAVSFFAQCRYFSVLAECQRRAITETCGGNLGNLHANFLLSFVPSLCDLDTLPQGQNHKKQNDRPGSPRKDLGLTDPSKKDGVLHRNKGPDGKNKMKLGYVDGQQKGIQNGDGQQSKSKTLDSVYFQAATGKTSDSQQTTMSANLTPLYKMPGFVSHPPAQEVTSTQGMTSTKEVTSTLEVTSQNAVRCTDLSCSTTGSSKTSHTSSVAAVSCREDFSLVLSLVIAIGLVLGI